MHLFARCKRDPVYMDQKGFSRDADHQKPSRCCTRGESKESTTQGDKVLNWGIHPDFEPQQASPDVKKNQCPQKKYFWYSNINIWGHFAKGYRAHNNFSAITWMFSIRLTYWRHVSVHPLACLCPVIIVFFSVNNEHIWRKTHYDKLYYYP